MLLAVNARQKAPSSAGWSERSWSDMLDEGYLSTLEVSPNIGVLLGPKSGGLVTVDLDDDAHVEAFLDLNPPLRNTLRTRGARGCQLWLWMAPDERFQKLGIPSWPQGWPAKVIKLKQRMADEGHTIGEWRGGAGQSIVAGIHPAGHAYEVQVNAPPLEYRWRDIVWPRGLARPWVADVLKAVEIRSGAVFESPDEGALALVEHGAAVWFSATHEVVFEAEEKQFYRYEPATGLWRVTSDEGLLAEISRALLDLSGDVSGAGGDFLRSNAARSQRVVKAIANYVRAEVEVRGVFANGGQRRVVHALNGMVHLDAAGPVLRPFAPSYFSRNQIPHDFVPGAQCPRFLRELLGRGFGPDDCEMVQRLAGLLLVGQNLAQKLVLLRGKGGAGKSRITALLQALVGEANVAALRPEKLNDRFELGFFIGKTALFGAELGPRVLMTEAASVLKSLTGGDTLPAELKGRGRPSLRGQFNIWGTTNFKAVVRVEGDVEAWERRLVVLDYDAPPPEKKIPDFELVLMREEGPGILAWAVEGARHYLMELDRGELLRMHPAAKQRVANLLDESRSVEMFVRDVVATMNGGDGVTLDEAGEDYCEWCGDRSWEPESHDRFSAKLKDQLRSIHRLSVSNGIERDGKAKRGFRNAFLRDWRPPELSPSGSKILD